MFCPVWRYSPDKELSFFPSSLSIHLLMDIYTVEYCSAMKKNELMPFAATLMDLEIIIPNEAGQRKANI